MCSITILIIRKGKYYIFYGYNGDIYRNIYSDYNIYRIYEII